jgi:hypothetical protein
MAICLLAPGLAAKQASDRPRAEGAVISGRITDPRHIRPEGAVLLLTRQEGSGSSSRPVPIAADDSFVTPALPAGTYVLELRRGVNGAPTGENVIGFALVDVHTADVAGVDVAVRPDVAIRGRFTFETDNPANPAPPSIVVYAFLAVDGFPSLGGTVAEGGPASSFVLRNAFGRRVVRTGYTLAPGSPPWWPSRVLLDGADITNVPTDFSEHPEGRLEVVFTQHPASISGVVTDAAGRPVDTPWILVTGNHATASQPWSTMSAVAQGDGLGRFSVTVPPGAYRVNAVPGTMFPNRTAARAGMERIVLGGVAATVGARENTHLRVILQER